MGDRFMPAVTQHFGRKLRRFRATFTLDAANNPTIYSPASLAKAGFASAEHTAQGNYRFVLADTWSIEPQEFGANYFPEQDNVDLYTQAIVSDFGDGRPAIIVRLKTGAVSTDPPASPNGGFLTVWVELETSP